MPEDEGRVRVFLVDDHEIVRRGVRELLEQRVPPKAITVSTPGA